MTVLRSTQQQSLVVLQNSLIEKAAAPFSKYMTSGPRLIFSAGEIIFNIKKMLPKLNIKG